MMTPKFAKKIIPAALLLLLGACVSIPDDNSVLPQRDLARAELAADIKLAHAGWPPVLWWTRYDDPQLNNLVEQALRDNPSMQSAAARFASARAALQSSTSEEGVSVDFNGAINRQRYSANGFFPPPIGGAYYTETTPQIVATYNFDWWGKHKAQIGAALGEVNARLAENAGTEQALVAAVAQSYYNIQGDWARLDNLQQVRALQEGLVQDKAKRIAHGVAASDSERLAEVELGNTRQQVTRLETQLLREREALRALIGGDAMALKNLQPRPMPSSAPALPDKLGLALLARRPDLQAARWRVAASLDRIEADKAEFYPDINLTGFIGNDVISFDSLLKYPSRTVFLGGTLRLPLFESGHLKAQLAGARSQRNEIIAEYNQSVIGAIREVAQEGASLQGLQKEIDEQAASTNATKAVLASAQARYQRGLADHAALLSAELAVDRQIDTALQLKNQQIQNEIALVKALGGGYTAPEQSVATGQAAVTKSK
jgi:multidrug efflux system outer membrane protein